MITITINISDSSGTQECKEIRACSCGNKTINVQVPQVQQETKKQEEEIIQQKAQAMAIAMLNENEIPDKEKVRKKGKTKLMSVSDLEQNAVLLEHFAKNFKGFEEPTK